MSRARLKANPTGTDFEAVGRVIMAAWLKSLPDVAGAPTPIDPKEISAALTNILNVEVEAVIDEPDKIYVVVPQLPAAITTKKEFVQYLHKKFDDSVKVGDFDNPFNPKNSNKHGSGGSFPKKRSYAGDFGDAVLFGCGR
jgi:hypothetical protein